VIKVDLHVHTYRSPDSLAMPDDIRRWARRHHIDVVAITDHDTITGALEMRRRWPEFVIVGEEIKTDRGEIIGLFLNEEIPAGLSPAETIRCIRDQGGLVYVPHPMDRVRGSALAPDALLDVVKDVDVIEVFNARVTFAADNRLAEEFALNHGLARGAGSDAHYPPEVGTAYAEMPPFVTAQEFLCAVRQARIHGRMASPLVHLSSTYARLVKGVMAALSPAR
jgi:predicted metal-dependent phosphoesterase TrpH